MRNSSTPITTNTATLASNHRFVFMCSSYLPIRCNKLLSGRGIDDRRDRRNAICGKAALLRVLANRLFIWSDIDAINLVSGDVALKPLDLRTHPAQDATRLLRDRLELCGRKLSGARDLSFNYVLRHNGSPSVGWGNASLRLGPGNGTGLASRRAVLGASALNGGLGGWRPFGSEVPDGALCLPRDHSGTPAQLAVQVQR